MKTNSIATAALLSMVPGALAFWRMECHGVAAIAEIDPIADPGTVGAHAHTIKGGNGLTENSTYQDLLASECTSCQVKQDKSGYWTPQLYFMNSNGSVHLVNEVPGHLTYYKYTPAYNNNGTLMMPEALPNGLRVISGDRLRRNFSGPVPDPPRPWSGKDSTQAALAEKAIGFNCLNYNKKPEDSLYRHFLPDKSYLENECPDGIRLEVLFPQCWDGRLDSKNHQAHMAFTDQGVDGGKCPEGFDHNLMQIFFETIFPTQNFKGVDGYYAFSNGDPTGYGYHGDLFVAWEEGVLQKALDACGSDTTGADTTGVTSTCPIFEMVEVLDQGKCLIPTDKQPKDLSKTPVLDKLPGNNAIQSGPQYATAAPGAHGAPQSQAYQSPPASAKPTLSYSQGSANVLIAKPTPVDAQPSTTMIKSVVTPPPQTPAAAVDAKGAATTVTWTSAGVVYEEAVYEDDVYVTQLQVVTVTQDAAVKARRRDHRARHNHARFHQH